MQWHYSSPCWPTRNGTDFLMEYQGAPKATFRVSSHSDLHFQTPDHASSLKDLEQAGSGVFVYIFLI
jgi:hypothetical protein